MSLDIFDVKAHMSEFDPALLAKEFRTSPALLTTLVKRAGQA